jgi:hypothetical protein
VQHVCVRLSKGWYFKVRDHGRQLGRRPEASRICETYCVQTNTARISRSRRRRWTSFPAKQKVTGPSRAVHALDALHATAGPTAPEPGSSCVFFLYKAPRLASNGNSPSTPSPKLSCPAAPDPSVAADQLTGDARDASMVSGSGLLQVDSG